jgi:hypothetical protein
MTISESLKKSWLKREARHGMMGTKFYNSWRSMTTRCRGTAGPESKRKYRDKGIRVCERWLKFKNFYEDMFPSYVEGLTIDRIKNDLGYFKENCRWADVFQQAENRGTTVWIEYDGKRLTLKQWAKERNMGLNSFRLRYHRFYAKGLITIDELFNPSGERQRRNRDQETGKWMAANMPDVFELEIIKKP